MIQYSDKLVCLDKKDMDMMLASFYSMEKSMLHIKELIENMICCEAGLDEERQIMDIVQFHENAAKLYGIDISLDGEVLKIHLDSILPRRKNRKSNFEPAVLADALDAYWIKNGEAIKDKFPVDKAVMLFFICYPREYEMECINDHDNLDVKGIIDAFHSNYIRSDNCIDFYAAYMGKYVDCDKPYTEILLMSQKYFCEAYGNLRGIFNIR